MLIEKPEKCGDCPYIRMYGNMHVCGFPVHTQEESMLDITSYKVSIDSCPSWCKMNEVNDFYENLPEEKQKALMAIANSIRILYS